jgi:hypothetical protein
MSKITYLKGDATCPIEESAIICHVVNNCGAWGAGFVLAISKMWKEPEQAYRDWFVGKFEVPQVIHDREFQLGNVQFVPVLPSSIWVANMIAQNNYRRRKSNSNAVFLDYDALNTTLEKVFLFANEKGLSVHMPRIGCGLAGGKWDLIEPIIEVHSDANYVDVYVYDFD